MYRFHHPPASQRPQRTAEHWRRGGTLAESMCAATCRQPSVLSVRVLFVMLLAIMLTSIVLPATPATAQAGPVSPPSTKPAAPASIDTASYELDARWDAASRQIHGTGTITYRNISADKLDQVWLKLYLNAFANNQTPWMREAAGQHRGSAYDPDRPGWIKLERLRLADTGEDLLPAAIDPLTTALQVPLPTARAIQPGETARIEVAWTSQLPDVFARTGVAGTFVMAGQWYPKLAVYDRGVWDTEPWHANAEFFADFGSYSLALTVPAGYITGATGTRASTSTNPDGTSTTTYWADSVSDIAWTAWPGYRLAGTVVEAAGRPVELELLVPRTLPTATDQRYFAAAQAALDLLGTWFGPYPWPKLTLMVPPGDADGAGGMEYPMLVTLGLPENLPFGLDGGVRLVEVVTVHEIAHQWAPMQAATNEAREAWLDEGFADYATTRALAVMYPGDRSMVDLGPLHVGYEGIHRSQYLIAAVREPLALPSWQYRDFLSYGVTVYSKGTLLFRTLEQSIGEERFLGAMRNYFDRWRWRHPTTADLQRSLEADLGQNLDHFFQQLVYGTGVVEYSVGDISASSAIIVRRDEFSLPVDVALTYTDGRTDRLTWDGQGGQLHVPIPSRDLARVQIDPDWKLRIAPNRLDDGRDVSPSPLPLTTLAARVLGIIQAVLLAGMLG